MSNIEIKWIHKIGREDLKMNDLFNYNNFYSDNSQDKYKLYQAIKLQLEQQDMSYQEYEEAIKKMVDDLNL